MLERIPLSEGQVVISKDDCPSVPVQDHSRDKTKTGRLWAYLGDRENPYIVNDYTPDRTAAGPEHFLRTYRSGYLQSDAFAGYDKIHARGIVEGQRALMGRFG